MSHFEALLQGLQDTLHAVASSIHRAKGHLRRSRNALVNVNTLPDEILRLVFVNAAQTAITHKIRISTTCWHWRRICFAFPRLWAEFHAPGFSSALVTRSISLARCHPLTVIVDLNMLFGCTKSVLMHNRTSIDSMELIVSSNSSHTTDWLQTDFPRLRRLRIQGSRRFYDEILPSLNGRTGNLRHAHFVHCRLPYSAHHYNRFYTLSISSDCADDDRRSGGDGDGSLFDALSGCVDLQELSLCNAPMAITEVEAHPQSHPLYPIRLPRLQSLHLSMAVQKASIILAGLATSESLQTIDLVLRSWDAARPERRVQIDKSLLLTLPSAECLPILSRLVTLSMHYAHGFAGKFAPCAEYGAPGHLKVPDSGAISIAFAHEDDLMETAFRNFLFSLLHHHGLSSLRALELQDFPLADTLRVLRAAPALETLTLSGSSHTSSHPTSLPTPGAVLTALTDARAGGDRLVPQLRTVVLLGSPPPEKEFVELSQASRRLAAQLELRAL